MIKKCIYFLKVYIHTYPTHIYMYNVCVLCVYMHQDVYQHSGKLRPRLCVRVLEPLTLLLGILSQRAFGEDACR